MNKDINQAKDFVISGVHIGEHSFQPDAIIGEIQERCIDEGMNFVTIRTGHELVPAHYFYEWAKFLADNKIYFVFLYTMQKAPEDRVSQLDSEIVANIKRIAGEYFIGDMIGEVGSSFACKMPGYFVPPHDPMPKQDVANMQVAKDNYIDQVAKYVEVDKSMGIDDVVSVEATALNKYNIEAGVSIPMLELMCGNPEILVSSIRGTARAFNSKIWGTYIAHEWYGGLRHDDILKQKRLGLAYKYAYLAGSNVFCLESGDEKIMSYGYEFDTDHEYCRQYRNVMRDFTELINSDVRPRGGPKVKVAFVQGNLDGWGGWGGSSIWSQFEGEQWGHSDPEYTWRILDELGSKRSWSDVANYGNNDLSSLPAYGQYDIIPVEASLDVMENYDYLIFTGWNTITDEIYKRLEKYVENGGRLFMSAAHLNTNPERDGEVQLLYRGRFERLFGCNIDAEGIRTNMGVKFVKNSLIPEVMYPGTDDYVCDPIYSSGYASYAKVELCGGSIGAVFDDSFFKTSEISSLPIALVENRLGDGVAVLLTSLDYPGHGAVYPLYRAIVRELITASHRSCDIKVYGSDKLRFAVYEGGKIYLLNTDYDSNIEVTIERNGKQSTYTLEPCELRII